MYSLWGMLNKDNIFNRFLADYSVTESSVIDNFSRSDHRRVIVEMVPLGVEERIMQICMGSE